MPPTPPIRLLTVVRGEGDDLATTQVVEWGDLLLDLPGLLPWLVRAGGLSSCPPATLPALLDAWKGLPPGEVFRQAIAEAKGQGALEAMRVPGEIRPALPWRPGKVIAVGRNYARHAAELGNASPEAPFFFLKAPSTAIGPGDPIVIPFDEAGEVHHEAELAVAIGMPGRRIPVERALDHVAGYLCANDVTARTEQKRLQEARLPWYGGKNADSFLVLGPGVAIPDTLPDPGRLRVQCLVDGQVRQDGNTAEMTHGVASLVAHASARVRLDAGDILLTGTPAGVGPLRPGETVEVRIEGVGSLVNPVVLEERPR